MQNWRQFVIFAHVCIFAILARAESQQQERAKKLYSANLKNNKSK